MELNKKPITFDSSITRTGDSELNKETMVTLNALKKDFISFLNKKGMGIDCPFILSFEGTKERYLEIKSGQFTEIGVEIKVSIPMIGSETLTLVSNGRWATECQYIEHTGTGLSQKVGDSVSVYGGLLDALEGYFDLIGQLINE